MTYDGPSIFLAPFGNEAARTNFQRTVLDGVEADDLAEHTERPFESSTVRVWGTKESVEGSWESIEPGDFLLFYRDGTYEYGVEVTGTEKNEALGKHIWPNYEEGKPWVCIIYLKEPAELDVDSAEIHELAGYDITYPMGFSPLNEMGVGGIRGRYGSVEEFVYGDREPGTTVEIDEKPVVRIPESILEGLYFPGNNAEEIVSQLTAALNADKHVILTGPPGTGKTEIARRTCAYLAEQHPDIYSGYRTTTATADWSTFETVGGYMPEERSEDAESLSFEPGQVLRRFKQNGQQRNELLVIDEINRADIDKAFGQLFTLLSGQAVQLPYKRDGEEIEIHPASEFDGSPAPHQYVMPSSWRILATMNSYDKTSLYEMSYAFMRRFTFIHVDAPVIPDDDTARDELVRAYADAWGMSPGEETVRGLGDVWLATNGGDSERKLGPALVKDMMAHVQHATDTDTSTAITQAVTDYVFPQLEGVRGRERTVTRLATVDAVDERRLARLAEDVLSVTLDE